jgi:CHAT domain-containing protein/Tfp pilus assembly protein PilF
MGMKFAYRVALALLVNLAIASGEGVPGMRWSIEPSVAQTATGQNQATSNTAIKLVKELQNLIKQIDDKNIVDKSPLFLRAGMIMDQLGKKQDALKAYEAAVLLSRKIENKEIEAYALNNVGRLHNNMGDREKALDALNKALPLWTILGKQKEKATTLNNIGRVYQDLGEWKRALEYYEQDLKISRGLNDKSGQIPTLNNIGSIFSGLGEKQKALEFYNQALLISRELKDRSNEAVELHNIGSVYSALGEKQKALEFLNQALPIRDAVNDLSGKVSTLNQLGGVYEDLGQWQKALDLYSQALPIVQALGYRPMEADILHNIGGIHSILGERQKALDFYNQALSISRVVGDRKGEARTLSAIAAVYSVLGDRQKALDAYNQALPISRLVGDRLAEAGLLSGIANIYADLGERKKALDLYSQSLSIRRTTGDRSGEAVTLNNIGSVYNDLGEKQKALESFSQALSIFRTVGNRSREASTLANMASLFRAQNKIPEALNSISSSIKIIEELRTGIQNDALKISYFSSVQGYYQVKIDILMQLHQQQPTKGYDAEALQTVDQSRARVLRELLIQSNANIYKDVSPELLKKEQILNRNIAAFEKADIIMQDIATNPFSGVPKEKSEELLAEYKKTFVILYAARDDLRNTIRRASPAYANLQYPKPITLAQIQQQLDPDTLMLQYSLGEKESYLWVIGQTNLKTYILPKRTDIEKSVTIFRKELQLTAPQSAIDLSQQILAPAADQLGTKRLVIIPDGILHTIPFAALNTPNTKTYNPLITQHEITNLPSASTIGILRTTVATKPRGPKQLAILADPIFRKDDPRLTGKTTQANNNLDLGEQIASGRVSRDLNLNRLPFTATEAKGILALVPNQDSTSAFGFDASYDWITNPKISQYRYVHLATHGFFDNDKPALSSIILSSFDAQGRDRRAFLRFPDLFNLNLPTELVVLSACETGLGNNIPGEGLVGMTRGLMYAGALRVAVSLWAVDDQATSDLMQDFYKNLWQSKKSHAASLREAQLKMHQQGKAPYYWAAFTLQGEWRN